MKNFKKIPYLRFLPIVIGTIVIYKLFDNIPLLISGMRFLFSLLAPFFWGFVIAYFLNTPMKYFERKFKLKRGLSLITVYLIFIGVLSFIIGVVTPSLFDNAKQIVLETPRYVRKTEQFINNNIDKFNVLNNEELLTYIQENLTKFVERSAKYIETGLNLAIIKIISFTSGFLKFIMGIVISIYMLKDKEKIIESVKKIIYALLNYTKGEQFIDFGREVNDIFSRYFIGKCLDSVIIGILCLIILTIIRSPYSIFISFVVGITNMIPYFGPFIGMIIGGIIVVFTSPIKALWVITVIFLLQQFDGLYLGPKILGDQVGVSALLVIFAVIVGGGLFGVIGMLIGVPVIAIFKIAIERMVNRKLGT